MSENRYLISEAARITQVEAHVLRYWEEELGLAIGRNKMGHRYYTDKDIRTFMNIKELKKKGLQLRAIREMLPEMDEQEGEKELPKVIVMSPQVLREQEADIQGKERQEPQEKIPEIRDSKESGAKAERKREAQPQRSEKSSLKSPAAEQDKKASDREKRETKEERFGEIMERLIHQLEKNERKEERYRRLDEAIRKHQQSRKLVAVTEEGGRRKAGKKKKRT